MKMKTKRIPVIQDFGETSRVRSYIVDVQPFEDLLCVKSSGNDI